MFPKHLITAIFYINLYMTQRKPYNPNTKYGRRKIRAEFHQKYNNMTPEQKNSLDSDVWIVRLILFIIVIVFIVVSAYLKSK